MEQQNDRQGFGRKAGGCGCGSQCGTPRVEKSAGRENEPARAVGAGAGACPCGAECPCGPGCACGAGCC